MSVVSNRTLWTYTRGMKMTYIRGQPHNTLAAKNIWKTCHPVQETKVPIGDTMPVQGTPFDFTTENKISTSIHRFY
nr:hypothetical protein [Tanacetum cinerariifolium]